MRSEARSAAQPYRRSRPRRKPDCRNSRPCPGGPCLRPRERRSQSLIGSPTLDKALDDENVRRRLAEIGCDVPDKARRGQPPLAALVKSEIARWAPIIKAANVKLE